MREIKRDADARGHNTVSLPELRRANVCLCLGTILCRARAEILPARGFQRIDLDFFDQNITYAIGKGQLAYYQLLESLGEIKLISSQAELKTQLDAWPCKAIGVILAMEGADPIVTPAQAEYWWKRGLRCVGLSHYGTSHYGVGTGESGPLTRKGVELLDEFKRLGMIVDLTHASDPSFFQILEHFDGPVLASHNACRALVPGDRQFSDEQLKLIIERNGVIGIPFDSWMLMPGFVIDQTPGCAVHMRAAVDHIDHICQLAGNCDHVAIGSDLDGGFGTEQSPEGLETIYDLHKLDQLLTVRGYASNDIDAIFHANWIRFFFDTSSEVENDRREKTKDVYRTRSRFKLWRLQSRTGNRRSCVCVRPRPIADRHQSSHWGNYC